VARVVHGGAAEAGEQLLVVAAAAERGDPVGPAARVGGVADQLLVVGVDVAPVDLLRGAEEGGDRLAGLAVGELPRPVGDLGVGAEAAEDVVVEVLDEARVVVPDGERAAAAAAVRPRR